MPLLPLLPLLPLPPRRYGFGSGAVWGRAFLEKSGAGGAPSPLRHLLSLFVASGATTSFLLWGRPLVFRWGWLAGCRRRRGARRLAQAASGCAAPTPPR